MLSKSVLDKLIPLPTEEELLERLRAELSETGFPLGGFKVNGVFYILARILVRIETELIGLCRTMLSNLMISSADRVEWLELRAADFSKTRKPALKTEGLLTLTRSDTTSSAKIRKGCIFKTGADAGGGELRYFSTADAGFESGTAFCQVPVTAESAGSAYNVPEGKITHSLLHLEGVTAVTNTADWITREGSDIEEIESLRARTLGAFADLATNPTRDKYRSACEAVAGVLFVSVDDMHPRGQGTIDIIVTTATGDASDAVLDEVRAAAARIAGPYDNILVKSSETVEQPVGVTIVLPNAYSDEGVAVRAEEAVRGLFEIRRDRTLNELYLSDIIVAVKSELPTAKSVRVTAPAADLLLGTDKVIIAGSVSVTIERA